MAGALLGDGRRGHCLEALCANSCMLVRKIGHYQHWSCCCKLQAGAQLCVLEPVCCCDPVTHGRSWPHAYLLKYSIRCFYTC